jgi:hypothetical protein
MKIGSIDEVSVEEGEVPSHVLVRRGIFNRDTYIPLDAVVKVAEGKAFVNIPKLVIGKMPWDEPPSAEMRRRKIGPPEEEIKHLYGSLSPSQIDT